MLPGHQRRYIGVSFVPFHFNSKTRKTHSFHKLTSEYTVFFSSKTIHDALRKRNLQISRLIIIDGSNDNNSVANYLETGKWLYINTILYKLVIKWRIHFTKLTNWNVFHDKILVEIRVLWILSSYLLLTLFRMFIPFHCSIINTNAIIFISKMHHKNFNKQQLSIEMSYCKYYLPNFSLLDPRKVAAN